MPTDQNVLEGRAVDVDAILRGELNTPLEAYLRKHRDEGLSYERIARRLSIVLPSAVTGTWVRRWSIRLGVDEGPE